MSFLRPNLDNKGRLIRGAAAVVLACATLLAWPHSRLVGSLLAASSAFTGFEAVRGWCALRACGVRTKF